AGPTVVDRRAAFPYYPPRPAGGLPVAAGAVPPAPAGTRGTARGPLVRMSMTRRKWLGGGLGLALGGGAAGAGAPYQRWTNPQAVRRQVLERLAAQFPGAAVSLESARLRLLGGVSLNELRLARRDDPDKADFLYVPQALVYHDKERLLDGKLRIRKL